MVAEFPRGGGSGLGPFPVPQISIPGYSFGGTPPYGYGVGFPGLFGIGSGGIELGPLTIPFSGPSPADVTHAAVQRLQGTGNPALRRLGTQIAASGLYTSSATAQPQLGSYVHEAVQTLESQGFTRPHAFNIVSDIISGKPTGRITPPAPQAAMFAPSRPSVGSFVSSFGRTAFPLALAEAGNIIGQPFGLGPQGAAVGEYVGGQIRDLVTNPPAFAPQIQQLPSFPAPSLQPPAANLGNMTSPVSQPGQFPIAPTLQPCPECGYNPPGPLEAQFQQPIETFPPGGGQSGQLTPASPPPLAPQGGSQNQMQQLRAQQQQLQQEIQTEQQQGTQQQIGQIQQQLDQLRAQEGQPIETRNVQQELQQKQQLQQQIQQLLNQPTGQQTGLPPGGTVPTLHYQSPPPLPPYEPPAETAPGQQLPVTQPQQIRPAQQLPVTQPQPGAPAFVKFCVFCTTQNESLKFLNGESSECSISPE
jgi:hypothetical protein